MSEYVKLNNSVKFGITIHNESGILVNADETPAWMVFEEKVDTPITNGNFVQRTNFIGNYRGEVFASGELGFKTNKYYEIHASGKVDNIVGWDIVKTFILDDVYDANIVQTSGNDLNIEDFKADTSSLGTLANQVAISGDVTTVKTQTDKLTFDSNNRIESSGAYTQDANIVRVSGELVHINDFKYSENDIYYADIKYVKDTINNQDEIGLQWYKNMTPITSGDITNPYLSLYNTSDGSSVAEHQDLSYAGDTGALRYNLTSNLFASGEPYLIITSGTIDSGLREWRHVVGIDRL